MTALISIMPIAVFATAIAATMGVAGGSSSMSLQMPARSRNRPASSPSKWLAVTEIPRAIAEAGLFTAWLPTLLAFAPRGDGHPVLVIPGMLANDASTAPLRGALESLGYDARGWGLGRNYGTRVAGADGEHLLALIAKIHLETGKRVSLVGWSLGGILARLAAYRAPDRIRQVITLGSPFAARANKSPASRVYETVSGTRLGDPAPRAIMAELRKPLRTPFTAIYSKSDGICAWRGCVARTSSISENIEVLGSHCGMGANPMVFHVLADRLAQAEGAWTPFRAGKTLLRSTKRQSTGHCRTNTISRRAEFSTSGGAGRPIGASAWQGVYDA